MHFRSKELHKRSAFPAKEMGKRTLDAWNRPERVYLDRPVPMSGGIVADFLLSEKATPYDHTVVRDFIGALSSEEQNVLDDLNAGFKRKEICQRQSITNIRLNTLHKSIQHKAVAYLSTVEEERVCAFLYAHEKRGPEKEPLPLESQCNDPSMLLLVEERRGSNETGGEVRILNFYSRLLDRGY